MTVMTNCAKSEKNLEIYNFQGNCHKKTNEDRIMLQFLLAPFPVTICGCSATRKATSVVYDFTSTEAMALLKAITAN